MLSSLQQDALILTQWLVISLEKQRWMREVQRACLVKSNRGCMEEGECGEKSYTRKWQNYITLVKEAVWRGITIQVHTRQKNFKEPTKERWKHRNIGAWSSLSSWWRKLRRKPHNVSSQEQHTKKQAPTMGSFPSLGSGSKMTTDLNIKDVELDSWMGESAIERKTRRDVAK